MVRYLKKELWYFYINCILFEDHSTYIMKRLEVCPVFASGDLSNQKIYLHT